MPQADLFTYMPQVFYHFIFWTSLYILISEFFIPEIANIFKVRLKLSNISYKKSMELNKNISSNTYYTSKLLGNINKYLNNSTKTFNNIL